MTAADKPMSRFMRLVFWFVAANALAGAVVLVGFPTRTDELFFWPITPPLNAALFGALYGGGAAVVALVTARGRWEPARFLVPVLVSAGILISVTTLLHLDRFIPGLRLAYWLVIYIGAPLLALAFYVQHERGGANWSVTAPVAPATRAIAVATGGLLVALGIAVLAWPGPVVANWPWPTTPLMVRIFASWFSAFGAGLLWFLVERDWTRLQHVATLMIAAAGLDLLALAIHRGDLTAGGLNLWLYILHLALFGLLGGLMWWLQRSATPAGSMSRSGTV
ncbi:MAG TPA: hypothetical protein VNL77_21775 [Roseiflexaceae bacterium]|nr:hypothetical protein [Roseiflexaceae bacterium]